MAIRRSRTGLRLACALLFVPVAACASGRGNTTDPAGSASAMASGDASASAGVVHGPGGTSVDGGGSTGATAPRGPGPGGTDASLPTPTASTSAPLGSASPAASGSGSASASAGAAAGPPPTFDIKSDCPDTLVLYLGDKPKKSMGKDITVPGRTTQTFPRGADGTATVWIVDGKGEGVVSGRVLASQKRVVIGLNCRSLQVE